MNSERWQKIKALFDAALELAPGKREQFLKNACNGDTVLRLEVDKMLGAFEGAESFMEQPAVRQVASLIIEKNAKLETGQTLAQYRIISKIGAGGMGDVYLAKDTRLNRHIAIKILSSELDKNESHLQRFIQEAQAASALNHPNIITIYEVGEFEDSHFIAAEYIEGETLRERLSRDSLGLGEILDISAQTASALSAAHKAGIIHRDIKPENIMIRREDNLVKVLDFGLAKLTEPQAINKDDVTLLAQVKTNPGVIMGTVAYMSPEQARGRQVDERTDIWSFGAVLYEMLTEKQPFASETMSDAIAAILKNEPAPLSGDTPPELNRIVRKTLEKNVDERYQTVKDLLLDLKNLKREVEFSEEIERSHTPSFAKSANAAATEPGENATAIQAAVSTQNSISPQTSSAEYLVGEFKKHKIVSLGALAVLSIALAIGAYFAFFASRNQTPITSIAVLPFENGSGDPNLEYLSDGMTESLISSLSQLPNLKIKARNSVFRYKGKSIEPQQIAKELNVQAILNGRVVQRGNDLTLYVELIDAQTENVLWKTDYNRSVTNLPALQNEIARDVSSKLKIKLSGVDERELAKTYTQNTEAYQLYLKGRFLQGKATPQDSQKATEYFQQAIALDPNFALAYVGLADASASFSDFNFVPPREFMPKAREFTLKALSLDDHLPEAHVSLGSNLLYYDYDFGGAEREFKRAIELNPNYADGHLAYGDLLALLGKREESFAELRRGLELDPISLPANHSYGWSLISARRYDEAVSQFKKNLELDANYFPSHAGLAFAYEMKGDYAASIAERVKINELVGTQQRVELTQKSFDEGGWQGYLRLVTNGQIPFPPNVIVAAYAKLGEKDKAFALLNKLYEAREGTLVGLKVDPRLDNLRDDPRFQDLLRRVGLPQ